ncbi:MAG TPA: SIR2 family protein [Thermoplasmata archaeon]|nr:SIR2 family protein [Thermoplasmata archaeon]
MTHYRRVFDSSRLSLGHEFVARLLRRIPNQLAVTTNFDTLIEQAFRIGIGTNVDPETGVALTILQSSQEIQTFPTIRQKKTPVLVKLHGSIDLPETMRETIGRLAEPIRNRLLRPLLDYVFRSGPHKSVLVIGYSGHDEYDVNPILRSLKAPEKRVVLVRHTSESLGENSEHGPTKGLFDDTIFLDFASESHDADTANLLRTISAKLHWQDLAMSYPSGETVQQLDGRSTIFESVRSDRRTLLRSLLRGSVIYTMLNMSLSAEESFPMGEAEAEDHLRLMVNEFERTASIGMTLGVVDAEIYGNFMLASTFSRWYSVGSQRHDRAGGHAAVARDIALKSHGAESAAYLRSAILCAILDEGASRDPEKVLPLYRRLLELARAGRLEEEFAICSVLVGRALCATGDFVAGREVLESELSLVEQYGFQHVLSAAYLILERATRAIGDQQAADLYADKLAMISILDGSPYGSKLKEFLRERPVKGKLDDEFGLAPYPRPPSPRESLN